ncbi:unnamed protein product [Darwinula stevensoni]|uniref:Ig-like domain-containing protein n=1 Tax=Darwinula stevensoni TaxID=69355 RepID=A0A7R8XEN3_9CRUS|nr:unnamed protein product [Darwinula stevensoni]CAG0894388.1 unnamed protein product [Darwinula stevensoni]
MSLNLPCSSLQLFVFLLPCLGGYVSEVRVSPEVVRSGDTITLECMYQENQKVDSVKWFRKIDEFFTYTPGKLDPIRLFDLPGVHVDATRSDARVVTLRNVSLETSGMYRCEVTDAGSYAVAFQTTNISVYELPTSQPTITMWPDVLATTLDGELPRIYHFNCSSPFSSPPANLTFYLYDDEVPRRMLIPYKGMVDSTGRLKTSVLGLRVSSDEVKLGRLEVKCESSIDQIYTQASHKYVNLLPEEKPKESQMKKQRPASSIPSYTSRQGKFFLSSVFREDLRGEIDHSFPGFRFQVGEEIGFVHGQRVSPCSWPLSPS